MSKGRGGNEGIVDLPVKVTFQDVEADRKKSKPIPKVHQNASVNPNDPMTSKNQQAEVRGNTEPTNPRSHDESPSLENNSESTTIDDIPNIEIYPAWINRTAYKTDTQRNDFMDEAVHHVDPQIEGVDGEAVHDISKMNGILQENVYHIGSEIHECVVKTAHISDPILEGIVQSTASEMGGILELTVQNTALEIGGVLEDTIYKADSKTGDILRHGIQTQENIYHIGFEIHDNVVDSTHNSCSGTDVQSINSEIGGILVDAAGLLQQPFPLYSAELSKNNTREANDNRVMSDILSDSAANLVENDMTQMSTSLTVNAKKKTWNQHLVF